MWYVRYTTVPFKLFSHQGWIRNTSEFVVSLYNEFSIMQYFRQKKHRYLPQRYKDRDSKRVPLWLGHVTLKMKGYLKSKFSFNDKMTRIKLFSILSRNIIYPQDKIRKRNIMVYSRHISSNRTKQVRRLLILILFGSSF